MSKLYIEGPNRLNGSVCIGGAKNSILPILAATLLCDGVSIIHNCPALSDVDASIKILEHLGCKCEYSNNTATVDATNVTLSEVPETLMREMRSSIVFLGAILARTGKATLSSPGGCELGPRPIDIHISGLEQLGIEVIEEYGKLFCSVKENIKGSVIHLSFPSVGATENIMLAASIGNGITIIHNAAKEPEISDLADFLNGAGAKISGAGSDTIEIIGVKKLYGYEHTIIPDRIITATYLSATAICGGDVELKNVSPAHLICVLDLFNKCGNTIYVKDKTIRIKSYGRLKRIPTLRTLVYPGFPTDSGPPVLAMLCKASGTTVFIENIFENRFKYIDELKRFGAKIKTEGKVAVIEGVKELTGASVCCTDLRGGAALVVAGLAAKGKTVIDDIYHIKRGYEDIVRDLRKLGANIVEE